MEKLKEMFTSKKLFPKVMVTNQEFFHVAKIVGAKYEEFVEVNKQVHVMKLWNNVMYSNRKIEYEHDL